MEILLFCTKIAKIVKIIRKLNRCQVDSELNCLFSSQIEKNYRTSELGSINH